MKGILKQKSAAIIALIVALPIILVFLSISLEISFLETAMKSVFTRNGADLNLFGKIIVQGSFILLPFALVLAIIPMIRKGEDGRRHWYILNLIVAVIILATMVPTWGELGKEIYRCEILDIPNCD